jgi:hypothetical protein
MQWVFVATPRMSGSSHIVAQDRATAESMTDVVSILATVFARRLPEFFSAESCICGMLMV